MRAFGRMLVVLTLAVVVAGFAGGQQPGGFFKGKGGGVTDPFSLAQNNQVKAELKLTDEQAAKMTPVAWKALGEVLNPTQLKRLREIYLRQKGSSVFLESDVKKELKITDAQASNIKAALDNQAKEQKEMFDNMNFDFEKMQELQKETTEKVQSVLTDPQKATWTKMIGEPFEMKFGFGKKKKDL